MNFTRWLPMLILSFAGVNGRLRSEDIYEDFYNRTGTIIRVVRNA